MLKLAKLIEATQAKIPFKITDSDSYSDMPVKCKLALIGDVHGAKGWYKGCCDCADYSIQLGDIHNSPHIRTYFARIDSRKHTYIHGNHDWIKGHLPPHYLGHYGTWTIKEFDLKIGFISGAFSVDRDQRMYSNRDPLHDEEELAVHQLEKAIELMKEEQPDVIVTHTAPMDILDELRLLPRFGKIRSRTNRALSVVLEECSPSLWAFGHFHQNVHFTYQDRVTFACVDMRTILPFV